MPVTDGVDTAHREAWRLFWRIFVADKPRRLEVLSELGLTFQQGMALSILGPDEPMPMSVLAERMHCDNSNVTGIADRLESAGLAERRPAAHDRRVRVLALTERGAEVKRRAEQRAGEPPEGFAALTDKEAAELVRLLAKAAEAQPGISR